jgi:quercetin dioxygenase-like cupin family protein
MSRKEAAGVASTIKLESVISGYLAELNGKYKLRVSELTFEPNGYAGEHRHLAPGMRVVTAGELTLIQAGETAVYKAGDAFYEPGDQTHVAHNRTNRPVVILSFEVVPAELRGSTRIPSLDKAGLDDAPDPAMC